MKNKIICLVALLAVGCASGPETEVSPDYVSRLSSGVWGTQCADTNGVKAKENFTLYRDMSVVRSTTYFSDQDCLVPDYTVNEVGTATLSYPQWGLVWLDVLQTYMEDVFHVYEDETGEEFYDRVACLDGQVMNSEEGALYGLTSEDLQKLSCVDGFWKVERSSYMNQISYIGGDGNGQLIDYNFSKVEVLIQSESAANSLSAGLAGCGVINAGVGDLVALTGDCQISEKNIYSKSGGKLGYDVVRVSGDSVYFGDDSLEGEASFNPRYAPFGPRYGGRRGKYENQVKNDRAISFDGSKEYKLLR